MTTTGEVIRLARKAADPGSEDPVLSRSVILSVDEMARLVDLVKAEENEACAKFVETQRNDIPACGFEFAEAIRARRNHG